MRGGGRVCDEVEDVDEASRESPDDGPQAEEGEDQLESVVISRPHEGIGPAGSSDQISMNRTGWKWEHTVRGRICNPGSNLGCSLFLLQPEHFGFSVSELFLQTLDAILIPDLATGVSSTTAPFLHDVADVACPNQAALRILKVIDEVVGLNEIDLFVGGRLVAAAVACDAGVLRR